MLAIVLLILLPFSGPVIRKAGLGQSQQLKTSGCDHVTGAFHPSLLKTTCLLRPGVATSRVPNLSSKKSCWNGWVRPVSTHASRPRSTIQVMFGFAMLPRHRWVFRCRRRAAADNQQCPSNEIEILYCRPGHSTVRPGSLLPWLVPLERYYPCTCRDPPGLCFASPTR